MRVFGTIFLCACLLIAGGCSSAAPAENYAAVVINEVVTCGNEYDWIELRNTSDVPVSLDGCFLSNDVNEPGKWQFPAVTLQGGEHLVLYAGSTTTSALSLPFRLKASGTTLIFSQHNGTCIQQLEIPSAAAGLSYGLYQNNYTWFAAPTFGKSNENGMVLGEDALLETEGLRINEYMNTNRSVLYDEDGNYSDWVEIHNFSDKRIILTGYTLTDARDDATKWAFPNGTSIEANGYLVVRCSGRNTVTANGEIHTAFKLGEDDSFLGLYNPSGGFCCGITVHPLAEDTSCGYLDGIGYTDLRYPTPSLANNPSVISEVSP